MSCLSADESQHDKCVMLGTESQSIELEPLTSLEFQIQSASRNSLLRFHEQEQLLAVKSDVMSEFRISKDVSQKHAINCKFLIQIYGTAQ